MVGGRDMVTYLRVVEVDEGLERYCREKDASSVSPLTRR